MEGQILHSKVYGKAPLVSLLPVIFYWPSRGYCDLNVINLLSKNFSTWWAGAKGSFKPEPGEWFLCSGLNSSLERDKGHRQFSSLNEQCGGTVGLLLCVWALPMPCAGRTHSSPLGQQVGRTGERLDIPNTPNSAPVMVDEIILFPVKMENATFSHATGTEFSILRFLHA